MQHRQADNWRREDGPFLHRKIALSDVQLLVQHENNTIYIGSARETDARGAAEVTFYRRFVFAFIKMFECVFSCTCCFCF